MLLGEISCRAADTEGEARTADDSNRTGTRIVDLIELSLPPRERFDIRRTQMASAGVVDVQF